MYLMQESYRIALVGFGEAAMAFVKGWRENSNPPVIAFDIKTEHADPDVAGAKRDDYAEMKVTGAKTIAEAVGGASVIFSLVTADQAHNAARAAARHIEAGSLFLDCNSCAPGTKRRSAKCIEDAGGRYVDVAVMSPVYPKMHKTPLLIAGPHSAVAMEILDKLQMDAKIMEGDIGRASSVKMVRSIMMKGLEALFAECVLAGRQAGVDEEVLASLDATYPGFDFNNRASYSFERMTAHGKRRSEEMKEVALTIEELGLPNDMAQATVQWHSRIGNLGLAAGEDNYQSRADAILGRLTKNTEEVEREE
jgi:3-hydroxyisobutyrate dehydrogenase-like beta-hydroxyacid dehydrogenase